MNVIVLISTYNGEAFLREQIDSVLAQTLPELEILVRDDGSSDNTHEILEEYRQRGLLLWHEGEHAGASLSFWRLLHECGEADYYAFCDQDDVWDVDKLEIATSALQRLDASEPALYCSDVRVADASLHIMSECMMGAQGTDFPHALVKNAAPGCTFVFNRAALTLLREYDAEALGLDLHDWTAYQIVACFGTVLHDSRAHMSYRQHGGNAIGAAKNSLLEVPRKVQAFWRGNERNSRERNALRLEQAFGNAMTPDNRRLTADVAYYRQDPDRKRRLLARPWPPLPQPQRLLFKLLIVLNRL